LSQETSLFGSFRNPLKAGQSSGNANYKRLGIITPPPNKRSELQFGTGARLAIS
jgi:hypothetical protein